MLDQKTNKLNKREVGSDREKAAVKYLIGQGYRIRQTNYSCKTGEIDIVAEEDGYLCFIEVKYRSDDSNGFPEDAVDARKAKKITRTALFYITQNGLPEDIPCRFDVVAMLGDRITLIRNAFDAVM